MFADIFAAETHPLSAYDLTVFFCIFVFMQVWNLFNARAFMSGHSTFHDWRDSKVFFGVLAAIFLGQAAIVYLGGEMFSVTAIPAADLAATAVLTSPIMLIPLLYDVIRRNLPRKAYRS